MTTIEETNLKAWREPAFGFIPYPSFEFLFGLVVVFCLIWFSIITGSVPLV